MGTKQSDRPEYRVWAGMKTRCYNPNHINFRVYGGLGIRVCERWRTSLTAFIEDMGERPGINYDIHRKNNDGDYEPTNCIWLEKKAHRKIPKRPQINRSITKRQREVFDYILEHEERVSYREIAAKFHMTAKAAFDHVSALEKKELVTKTPHMARSIRVVNNT